MCEAKPMPDSEERRVAEPNTILRVVAGSQAAGTSLDGENDRDEIGVCVEPPEYVIGHSRFEQWEYRDAVERAKAAGQAFKNARLRSEPGDLDLKIYSLRKFCAMCLECNPNSLQILYAPDSLCLVNEPLGQRLRAIRGSFMSKRIGLAFAGYLHDQRDRLIGKRSKNVTRPELVEKYGYDTKFAYHMLRLGLQGIEFLRTGSLTLPIYRPDREFLIGVRNGRITQQRAVKIADQYEETIKALTANSSLPEEPDYAAVNKFMVEAYLSHWKERGYAV